jgi:Cell Wall Hydrolase
MIIRREQPQQRGYRTKAKTFGLASLALLTMSSVSSVQAEYAPVPGVRGAVLEIPLDAPTPLNPGDSVNLGITAPLTPGDPGLDSPVPMPELMDMAAYGISPTPPADYNPLPFQMPSQFNSGTSASSYIFASRNPTDSARSAICLTSAIYYEAATESDDGQRAVAQVVLNRVRHPAWPNTVCGVVYQGSDRPGCQFSFACDGAMARAPSAAGWARASRIARTALAGYVYTPVGLSTFYHTPQVNPGWNRRLIVAARIGNHIFYRMPGTAGTFDAFHDRYAGGEPFPAPKPRAYVPPAYAAVPRPGQAIGAAYPATATPYPQMGNAPVPMPGGGPYPRPAEVAVQNDNRYVAGALPESDIMPAYRDSGSWIKR